MIIRTSPVPTTASSAPAPPTCPARTIIRIFSPSMFNPFTTNRDSTPLFSRLTASSGVNASARIFGGSHFPGSISYSTTYNSSGNFDVPGLANYTTHGNNDMLAINWGVHLDEFTQSEFQFLECEQRLFGLRGECARDAAFRHVFGHVGLSSCGFQPEWRLSIRWFADRSRRSS